MWLGRELGSQLNGCHCLQGRDCAWVLRTKLQVGTLGDGLRKTRQDSRSLAPIGGNRGVRWASILIKVPA